MAVVVVTVDNLRVEDCEAYTGWANFGSGSGGAAEAPFAYQGSTAANRKITDAAGKGIGYTYSNDGGSAIDMTASTRRTWMVKAFISDWNGLDATDGALVLIGSSSSNYYAFMLAGSDSPASAFDAYRATGGYLVVPVDPNLHTTYNDTAKDSATAPTLTSIDFFAFVGAFSSPSAKSENLACDAIDVGTGLYLVGGDGVSADGVWQDFVDHDEGTTSNRYGYARNGDGGVILAFGNWRIGENSGGAVNTAFTDSTAVLYWLDHLANAGFSVVTVNLGNASTVVVDDCLHIGAGDDTNIDSRPDYTVTGTAGTFTFGGTLRNFRNITLTSACTVDGGALEFADLTLGSAEIANAILRPNSASATAACNDPTFGTTSGIHDTQFIQAGVGHAIEVSGTTAITLTNLTGLDTSGGFGANTTNDAALYFSAGSGTIDVTLSGTSEPTYRSAGVTVNFITNPVTLTITVVDSATAVAIQNARVLVLAESTFTGGDSVSITRSGSTATVTHTSHGFSTGNEVRIAGATQNEYNGLHTITVTTANAYTYTVSGTPATPATGSPISALVVINGMTNASGVVSDTRSWLSNQDFSGRVRKGTSTPTYKTQPVAGTINSSTGATATAPMVGDD